MGFFLSFFFFLLGQAFESSSNAPDGTPELLQVMGNNEALKETKESGVLWRIGPYPRRESPWC